MVGSRINYVQHIPTSGQTSGRALHALELRTNKNHCAAAVSFILIRSFFRDADKQQAFEMKLPKTKPRRLVQADGASLAFCKRTFAINAPMQSTPPSLMRGRVRKGGRVV